PRPESTVHDTFLGRGIVRGPLSVVSCRQLVSDDNGPMTTDNGLLTTDTMKVLVANLGSTSFKYRLFDMTDERQLARGGIERIGSPESPCFVEIGGRKQELKTAVPDHAVAVRKCLDQLTDPETGCLKDASEVSAIGFKAVHGGRVSGVQRVNADLLSAMEQMSQVAPAHNPPYIRAMRL